MEVFTDINNIQLKQSVICVGTFDGLHQGHKVVIDKTIAQAKKLNAKSLVFTFWPHPHEVIFPEKQVYYLNTFQEKIDLFSELGIDYLVLYPFNKEFANKTSKEFIKDFLVDKLKMKFFVIGYDHQFGKEREGKYEKMITCAKEHGFGIERVEQQAISEEFVSSTKIRKLIKGGEIELANSLLGYTYFTSGTVVKGKQIGAKIGFPTANLIIAPNKIIPQKGVYSVKVSVDKQNYIGMANIGFKPTINEDKELSLEVNLFNFEGNLYNKDIRISFYKKIRDEKKFGNLNELKSRLELDKEICIEYFKAKY
jgi:riboflavin kinase/FMN adenylyltransferase